MREQGAVSQMHPQYFYEEIFSWTCAPGKLYSSLWPVFLGLHKSCEGKVTFSDSFELFFTSIHLQKVSLQTHPFLDSQRLPDIQSMVFLLVAIKGRGTGNNNSDEFPLFLLTQLAYQRTSGTTLLCSA